jgi:hypothetical protein
MNLKEQIFEVSSNLELAKSFFPEVNDLEAYHLAHCICIGEDQVIAGTLSKELGEGESLGFMSCFSEYLKRSAPQTFKDFLFLLDFYRGRRVGRSVGDIFDLMSHVFPKIQIVDEILEDSRGLLLWHHQLEHLFRAFYDDITKVVRLRKQINAKVPDAFDIAESLKFDGISLADIVEERMVLGFTVSPNVKGASTLYKMSGDPL